MACWKGGRGAGRCVYVCVVRVCMCVLCACVCEEAHTHPCPHPDYTLVCRKRGAHAHRVPGVAAVAGRGPSGLPGAGPRGCQQHLRQGRTPFPGVPRPGGIEGVRRRFLPRPSPAPTRTFAPGTQRPHRTHAHPRGTPTRAVRPPARYAHPTVAAHPPAPFRCTALAVVCTPVVCTPVPRLGEVDVDAGGVAAHDIPRRQHTPPFVIGPLA